jgi:hypothetical protein
VFKFVQQAVNRYKQDNSPKTLRLDGEMDLVDAPSRLLLEQFSTIRALRSGTFGKGVVSTLSEVCQSKSCRNTYQGFLDAGASFAAYVLFPPMKPGLPVVEGHPPPDCEKKWWLCDHTSTGPPPGYRIDGLALGVPCDPKTGVCGLAELKGTNDITIPPGDGLLDGLFYTNPIDYPEISDALTGGSGIVDCFCSMNHSVLTRDVFPIAQLLGWDEDPKEGPNKMKSFGEMKSFGGVFRRPKWPTQSEMGRDIKTDNQLAFLAAHPKPVEKLKPDLRSDPKTDGAGSNAIWAAEVGKFGRRSLKSGDTAASSEGQFSGFAAQVLEGLAPLVEHVQSELAGRRLSGDSLKSTLFGGRRLDGDTPDTPALSPKCSGQCSGLGRSPFLDLLSFFLNPPNVQDAVTQGRRFEKSVYVEDENAGGHTQECQCPDGTRKRVGDRKDNCESLSCFGYNPQLSLQKCRDVKYWDKGEAQFTNGTGMSLTCGAPIPLQHPDPVKSIQDAMCLPGGLAGFPSMYLRAAGEICDKDEQCASRRCPRALVSVASRYLLFGVPKKYQVCA